MASSVQMQAQGMRGCPFCGKPIRIEVLQCPFCREAIQQVQVKTRAYAAEGSAKIRRGLLYVLLGAVAHYFAAGYSGLTLPLAIPAVVTTYGTPLIFACGLALIVYGGFLYLRG
jgi:hypothetical protein